MNSAPPTTSPETQAQNLRNYLARNAADGRAWLLLAQILSEKPPGKELRKALDHAVKLLPDNYRGWLLAIRLRQREQGDAAAENWIDAMIDQNPKIAAPRLARASIRSTLDPEAAMPLYEQVIESFPRDVRAYVMLAGLQIKNGRASDAESNLEAALRLDPGSQGHWGMLADARLQQGKLDGAVEAASRSISLDANQAQAFMIRAEAYRKSLHWDQALADFQQAEKNQPPHPRLLNSIGTCLVRMERYPEAGAYFEKALSMDPEFAQARLNIGLLCAVQLKTDEAISRIAAALESEGIDPESRRSAQVTLKILKEQSRLQPLLERAVQTGSVDELQSALGQSPEILVQPDPEIVEILWKLAGSCRELDVELADSDHYSDPDKVAFIEACAQCKVSGDAHTTAALYRELAAESGNNTLPREKDELRNAWRVIRERRSFSLQQLKGANGEAWFRYWHARVMNEDPSKQAGHYKAIPNTIGQRPDIPITAPECVAGTIRVMLAEIWPTVPAGLASGIFIYVGVCLVHGFGDGNGRLSRFLLAWAGESAGEPAMVIPANLRLQQIPALQQAMWEGENGPLLELLENSQAETGRLLKEFNKLTGPENQ